MLRLLILILLTCVLSELSAEPYIHFNYIGEEQGIENPNVEAIVQDHDGYMWFGTQKGLYRFDGQTSKKFFADGKPGSLLGDDIYDLLVTETGDLWVATSTAGVAKYDKRTRTFKHISDNTTPNRISHYRASKIIEHEKRIWVQTDNGINSINVDTNEVRRHGVRLENESVNSDYFPIDLIEFNAVILIVIDGGVYKFNERLAHFEGYDFSDYKSDSYLSSVNHFDIYSDKKKNMYIYTDDGIFFVDVHEKIIRKENINLPKDKDVKWAISDFFKDSRDTVWIIVNGEGLFYKEADQEEYSVISYGLTKNQLNTNNLYEIYEDRTGNIWIGTARFYATHFTLPSTKLPYYTNARNKEVLNTDSVWTFSIFNQKMYS